MNHTITPEQTTALANTFKYMKSDVKEICFANNNMNDKQFADLLTHMTQDPKQFNNLHRITYGSNNELGWLTLEVLDKFLRDKHPNFPLTHLALVNCKRRIRTIEPLLMTLNTKENHLESLIIPQQSFGKEGFGVLCKMISQSPSFLRTLDISWNKLFGK